MPVFLPKGSPYAVTLAARHWLWLAFGLIAFWRLWAAWLLPVTQDEAYYFDWARRLDWGYFDHPPGVALLAQGVWLAPASALAGRLGNWLAATMTLLVLLQFYRACGLDTGQRTLALILTSATLAGLGAGVLATPDTPLALAWSLTLHEGLAALRDDRRRWISAGLATGLGLLGKYAMALIGPVFLWAILWADPKALRTPWPYAGALAALLVFAPNLIWNAQQDWLTIRFQFGHGFSTSVANLADAGQGAALALPERTSGLEQAGLEERLWAVLNFAAIQAACWGLMLLPLLAGLWPGRRQAGGRRIDRPVLALLVAGTGFPLLFFGALAAFSTVQANWALVYLLTALPLVMLTSPGWRKGQVASAWGEEGRGSAGGEKGQVVSALAEEGRSRTPARRGDRPAIAWPGITVLSRSWLIAAAGNYLLVSAYVIHASTTLLPLPESQQRILRETHGFAMLAREVAALPGPVFADRYQLVAMTRFYAPGLAITQWPAHFRPSEYSRGRLRPPVDPAQVVQAGGFWLLSHNFPPRPVPGFRLAGWRDLFDCLDEGLQEGAQDQPAPCLNPIHRWWLYRYVANPEN